MLAYRADYIEVLYNAAIELGVEVIVNARVQSVDEENSRVELFDGRTFDADLIIGADGIRSKVRRAVIPNQEIMSYSTNYAYRATVPAEVMRSDPEIAHLMDECNSNFWIGPKRHLVGYPMKGGELYNLVLIVPGLTEADKWNEPGDLQEMRDSFSDFDPVLRKVLTHITNCRKWALAELPIIPQWVSRNGNIVLVGDSAHAMLPCLAQVKYDIR